MPMTLDDIVAKMRERFTPQQAGVPVPAATITAEEWNVLASFVYLRDAAKALADAPVATPKLIERVRDEILLSQDVERAGSRQAMR